MIEETYSGPIHMTLSQNQVAARRPNPLENELTSHSWMSAKSEYSHYFSIFSEQEVIALIDSLLMRDDWRVDGRSAYCRFKDVIFTVSKAINTRSGSTNYTLSIAPPEAPTFSYSTASLHVGPALMDQLRTLHRTAMRGTKIDSRDATRTAVLG